MAVLSPLLVIIGAAVAGDLVLENTSADAITVLHHPITGYSGGLLWPWLPRSGSWLACWWLGR